jgi:diguanylate cyclase (GGDEF)-like protein
MIEIATRRQALQHTAQRVVVAVCSTIVLTLIMTIGEFGADLNATVSVGFVVEVNLIIGIIVSALLTGGLTYRSALLMRELHLARAELQRISRTDQLTGLLNRRGFDELAVLSLQKAIAMRTSAAALMCDIDRFKAVNDQFGHEFGDKVLVEIAGIVGSFAQRNGMVAARHGGEEFAVFMIGVTAEQATEFANTLRQSCSAMKIGGEGFSTNVTVSIGLTVSQGATNLPHIMRIADQALYAAKHRGRDRVARAEFSESIAA